MTPLDPYATHQQALITAVARTTGSVLELGAGHYSTPVLSALCGTARRFLVTAEHEENWLAEFKHLENYRHALQHVTDWATWDEWPAWAGAVQARANHVLALDEVEPVKIAVPGVRRWGVAFIDHGIAHLRGPCIEKLRDTTEVFVVHDTEQMKMYGYDAVLPKFKYAITARTRWPYTSIVSDVVDVTTDDWTKPLRAVVGVPE